MPQLWLPYQEIADELGSSVEQARVTAKCCGWSRKRSRDGLTRVMVPSYLMNAFFSKSASLEGALNDQTDAMVAMLRKSVSDGAFTEAMMGHTTRSGPRWLQKTLHIWRRAK